MRLFNKNILLALALLAAAQGCDKEPVTPQDTGAPIMLSATETGTKALLENGTFNKNGNRLVIYDYVDNSTTPYFVDQIGPDVPGNNYGYTGVWPFVNEPHQWTPGVHKFFGWLAKDANFDNPDTEDDDESMTTEAFFALNDNSFNEATKVLSIPAKEITKETPQFDFLYSNIISTEAQQEPVGLTFSHLFTAFRITALNRDPESTITIKSITLSGLKTLKSAIIDFSGSEPTVTYTTSGGSSDFAFTFDATVGTLNTQAKAITDAYLLWPQKQSDFLGVTMSINWDHTIDGQTSQNSRPEIPLGSALEWNAGVVNSLNIEFDLDQITFYINSLEEWNHNNNKDIIIGL